ncbi:T9SS type A sorting domain-containing protein [Dyadobacter sp. 676]|uniref:T9SS type A sorting domain-containing protein n=1 Tax=Dyadobacter sp. 676 TaxID=3088362 RepID=A0AAU8FK91_9BACT
MTNNFYEFLKLNSRQGLQILTSVVLLGSYAHGQQGSQGNTTIFGGAQMSFFANHDFVAGGGGAQPGVILTERQAGNFGILNFVGDNLTSTGASDAAYVDGYVRKYGSGQFVFPVGDNGSLGPFAASGDGTMGAYFRADPNTAVTSNLFTGSDYAALPNGGPFPTSSMGTNVEVVSTVEYWDIDGAAATPLTLTWDASSAIASLTGGQISKLTIAGWDGTSWVAIPSRVDAASVLGGNSDLNAGSITTVSPLAPDTYTAYTFASLVVPLPVTLTRFTATAETGTVLLSWSTTEEKGSDRFEIERSNDGKVWAAIGSVASRGESKVLVDYQFTDVKPAAGTNLYRLRMVDTDGTYAFSSIREVKIKGVMAIAYPNPVAERLLIPAHGQVKQATLTSLSGMRVLSRSSVSADGLDVRGLAPGIYTLSLTLLDGTISTQKVAVSR